MSLSRRDLIGRLGALPLVVGGVEIGQAASATAGQAEQSAAQPHGADAQLREIYTAEWRWRSEQFAVGKDGKEWRSDRLPKVDATAQQERLRYWQDVQRRLGAIPRADLSAQERLNYDVYYPEIQALIASQQFREYEAPVNSDLPFWTQFTVLAHLPFRSEDYLPWIAKMRDIPRYFREQTEQMRAGLKRGFTPPRVTIDGRESALTTVTDVAPEATLFYVPFKGMQGVPPEQQVEWRAEALDVIRGSVQPAYGELLTFMRTEYLPGLRTTIAAQDLPDGKAYYAAKIREYTTLDLDADSIHQLGIAEVARLHVEMLSVMKESGFGGDFPSFLKFLRTDPRFYAKTASELLMRAAWIAKKFDAVASVYFGYLPRARFAIKPVPDDIAPSFTAGRGGPGLFSLNTYDLPSRPLYNLPALTLHESAPGHAFQIPIELEHKDQPDFRRHSSFSAYGEGWALYCEWLGAEMGIYETPYERFGMLGYQIWRAARLVVDTGIHSQGWSRERARAYLMEYTVLSEHEIETEVDRYISWPAQALSYYLGERAILESRAKAEKELGTRFNIRAFHDTVLELGSVPLPVLTARIDRFVAEGGKGPYPDME
jgi:uncharacterized protein (DUF885 family)